MLKKLENLKNKKIAVLGLGIENYALIKYLLNKKINCAITICDNREPGGFGKKYTELNRKKNISWKLGKAAHKHLNGFDVLFRSPGWPIYDPEIIAAVKLGVKLSSPINLFFELSKTSNIIGVTGTKGKGTTASLIYSILKYAKKRVWLGGNIGVAPFSFFDKIKKNDWVILELSSFQLEDMKKSPRIAIITNFTKEHLSSSDPNNPNCHTSMQRYWQAKYQIIKWQKRNDYAVISQNLKVKIKPSGIKAKLIYFNKANLPNRLIGEHNKKNIAAALEAAKIIQIKNSLAEQAIEKFRGLEHRIEFVKKNNKINYYDDSFATTPDAAITAIKAFNAPIILLAGGSDKGSNFKKMAKMIKRKINFAILFHGQGSKRLKKELIKIKYPEKKIRIADSMKTAIKITKHITRPDDIVLLSPGCASFGVFKNYKERGNLFKQEVKKL